MSEELRKAGYVLAMFAIQSGRALDDEERAACDCFLTRENIFAALSTAAAPQEPYGWVTSRGTFTLDRRQMEANPDLEWTALYATPAAPVPRDVERYQWLRTRAWFSYDLRGLLFDEKGTTAPHMLDDAIDRALDAAPRAQPSAPAAPVPREPTEEMLRAGCDAVYGWYGHPEFDETAKAIYRAMYDAAPRAQPVAQEDVRAADVLRRMLGNQTVTDGELQSALNAAIRSLTSARTEG